MNEREIKTRDVLEMFAAFVIAVSAVVGIYALIWGAWFPFRVAVTVIVTVAILTIAAEYLADKIGRK